jgi:hypothetical protein
MPVSIIKLNRKCEVTEGLIKVYNKTFTKDME